MAGFSKSGDASSILERGLGLFLCILYEMAAGAKFLLVNVGNKGI